MIENFIFLADRISFIKLNSDHSKNFELYLCLSEFESYLFGIISQYDRIFENTNINESNYFNKSFSFSNQQLKLDIYYYTLTWDKLLKVFEKFKNLMNILLKNSTVIPDDFKNEYKDLKIRFEHLLKEFDINVRNEYEHPTLKPIENKGIIEWGSTFINKNEIKIHVGNKEFAIVNKKHIEKLNSLWINLIDLFIKYFSDKPLTSYILDLRNQIESNIDELINEYNQLIIQNNKDEANTIIKLLLGIDIFFKKENVSLSEKVLEKIYSMIYKK